MYSNGLSHGMATSFFKDVPLVPTDEVFARSKAFKDDTHPNKVNLGIGAYRDEEGRPFILPIVAQIEAGMSQNKTLNHEYLPIEGMKSLSDAAAVLAYGSNSPALLEDRVCCIQSLSGTGSLRVGFEFLKRFHTSKEVYVPTPTWGNHKKIIVHAGLELKSYKYYDDAARGIDIVGMLTDLENAPPGSCIVLHACAHNPTGVDPSPEQWMEIARVMKRRGLFPFFDMAYQGFVSDVDTDAFAIRHFVDEGFELMLAQSFAKNFGLYNERVGALSIVTSSSQAVENILSQLKAIVRPMYSNPPHHGAYIVSSILCNPAHTANWKTTLADMSNRIKSMRSLLYQKLKALGTPGDWSHIINQKGMFTYTGLKPKQVDFLTMSYHIHLMGSGRINMCGICNNNVDYVAQAIHDAVVNVVDEDPMVQGKI